MLVRLCLECVCTMLKLCSLWQAGNFLSCARVEIITWRHSYAKATSKILRQVCLPFQSTWMSVKEFSWAIFWGSNLIELESSSHDLMIMLKWNILTVFSLKSVNPPISGGVTLHKQTNLVQASILANLTYWRITNTSCCVWGPVMTPSGFSSYNVMTFGLWSSSATFQRLMNRVASVRWNYLEWHLGRTCPSYPWVVW